MGTHISENGLMVKSMGTAKSTLQIQVSLCVGGGRTEMSLNGTTLRKNKRITLQALRIRSFNKTTNKTSPPMSTPMPRSLHQLKKKSVPSIPALMINSIQMVTKQIPRKSKLIKVTIRMKSMSNFEEISLRHTLAQ